MTNHPHLPAFPPSEPESLAQLRGDCARMAPHWHQAADAGPVPGSASGSVSRSATAPAGRLPAAEASHGVRVPSRSAQLVAGMSEYGN
ncbi:hypothetical protein [Streptomyces sp. Z26]|uniref:hypothetical protein n=1 Tax=Streptomyces sp. Z26 TaxID=2500177 RepID=UPI000EF13F51|nr:hypothetical protein [Streptomyces sp. Z26]RLL66452.1 hypothetical protein D7M15_05630 [Streptomyces sp. Z26]